MSAKDLGTGKEQTVRIEQSSGLSDDEINRMRKDAEEHAAEDKGKRDLVEKHNVADQMCFQVEKLMKEHADKLKPTDREPLEKAVQRTRDAAKGNDLAAIKSAIDELEQASHAFSKTLYEGAARSADAGPGAGPAADAGRGAEDDTIDAEFEVKDN